MWRWLRRFWQVEASGYEKLRHLSGGDLASEWLRLDGKARGMGTIFILAVVYCLSVTLFDAQVYGSMVSIMAVGLAVYCGIVAYGTAERRRGTENEMYRRQIVDLEAKLKGDRPDES